MVDTARIPPTAYLRPGSTRRTDGAVAFTFHLPVELMDWLVREAGRKTAEDGIHWETRQVARWLMEVGRQHLQELHAPSEVETEETRTFDRLVALAKRRQAEGEAA